MTCEQSDMIVALARQHKRTDEVPKFECDQFAMAVEELDRRHAEEQRRLERERDAALGEVRLLRERITMLNGIRVGVLRLINSMRYPDGILAVATLADLRAIVPDDESKEGF